MLQNLRAGTEKLYAIYNQIIKVHGVVLSQFFLVFPVEFCLLLFLKVCCFLFAVFRSPEFILCCGYVGKHILLLIIPGIHIQFLKNLAHQRLLVVSVINRKIRIIPQILTMSAQDSHAGRMKGADPYAVCPPADCPLHTLLHLRSCLIGKCNRQNIPWINCFLLDQIGNPVGQHSGLSGPGACQNQERPLRTQNRFLLPVIQYFFYIHSQPPFNSYFTSNFILLHGIILLLYYTRPPPSKYFSQFLFPLVIWFSILYNIAYQIWLIETCFAGFRHDTL